MALCVEVLVALLIRHDVRTLQAKIQRPDGDDRVVVRVDVGLRNNTRFIVYELEDGTVVLERLLARILEHLSHVFCAVKSILALERT